MDDNDKLDARQLRIIKEFTEKFSIDDVDDMHKLLEHERRAQWFWGMARWWGSYLGGGLLILYTMRDWIAALIKKLLA